MRVRFNKVFVKNLKRKSIWNEQLYENLSQNFQIQGFFSIEFTNLK
jgi:hypothetical protein